METRANYIAIGSIVLVTILAAFVFVWWLAVSGEGEERRTLRVIFPGAVTGLEVGGQVFFNGIRVGEVSRLTFAENDPTRVVALTAVRAKTPLRPDTKASLGFSGLTGVAYIELVGGSKDQPSLLESQEDPELVAERSGFQDLMQGARDVLSKADQSLTTINGLIDENRPAVTRAVNNISDFTDALASNSDGIGDFMASIGDATKAFTSLSGRLEGLVQRAESVVVAVDPEKVSRFVDNVANASDRLDSALAGVDGIVADARNVTGELTRFSTGLNASLEKIDNVISAVEREKIESVIANVDTLTSRLAAKTDDFDALIADARGAASSIRATSDAVAEKSEQIAKFIDDAGMVAEELTGLGTDVRAILNDAGTVVRSVDPARIAGIVEAVDTFTSSIAGQTKAIEDTIADARGAAQSIRTTSDSVAAKSERIAKLIDDAGAVAEDLTGVGASVKSILADAGNVVRSVNPEQVSKIVTSVETFTTGVAGQTKAVEETIADARGVAGDARAFVRDLRDRQPDIDAVITDARNVSGKLNDASGKLNDILVKVEGYVEGDGKGLIAEATAAARSIRVIADAFRDRATPIADGFARFSNRGLRDMETLIEQARQTLVEIQKVFANFDRNPSRVLYGGDSVPVYEGGRQRR